MNIYFNWLLHIQDSGHQTTKTNENDLRAKREWKSYHLVQFYYGDQTAVREDQNTANTWTKIREKRWKWTAMAHTFAKMSNVFDGAWIFGFSTIDHGAKHGIM